MVYKIKWTKKAERQFSKLDGLAKYKVIKRIESIITDDPFLHVTKLSGLDAFKLRAGNYRMILAIEKNSGVVVVLVLGHRKNIYKNLR